MITFFIKNIKSLLYALSMALLVGASVPLFAMEQESKDHQQIKDPFASIKDAQTAYEELLKNPDKQLQKIVNEAIRDSKIEFARTDEKTDDEVKAAEKQHEATALTNANNKYIMKINKRLAEIASGATKQSNPGALAPDAKKADNILGTNNSAMLFDTKTPKVTAADLSKQKIQEWKNTFAELEEKHGQNQQIAKLIEDGKAELGLWESNFYDDKTAIDNLQKAKVKIDTSISSFNFIVQGEEANSKKSEVVAVPKAEKAVEENKPVEIVEKAAVPVEATEPIKPSVEPIAIDANASKANPAPVISNNDKERRLSLSRKDSKKFKEAFRKSGSFSELPFLDDKKNQTLNEEKEVSSSINTLPEESQPHDTVQDDTSYLSIDTLKHYVNCAKHDAKKYKNEKILYASLENIIKQLELYLVKISNEKNPDGYMPEFMESFQQFYNLIPAENSGSSEDSNVLVVPEENKTSEESISTEESEYQNLLSTIDLVEAHARKIINKHSTSQSHGSWSPKEVIVFHINQKLEEVLPLIQLGDKKKEAISSYKELIEQMKNYKDFDDAMPQSYSANQAADLQDKQVITSGNAPLLSLDETIKNIESELNQYRAMDKSDQNTSPSVTKPNEGRHLSRRNSVQLMKTPFDAEVETLLDRIRTVARVEDAALKSRQQQAIMSDYTKNIAPKLGIQSKANEEAIIQKTEEIKSVVSKQDQLVDAIREKVGHYKEILKYVDDKSLSQKIDRLQTNIDQYSMQKNREQKNKFQQTIVKENKAIASSIRIFIDEAEQNITELKTDINKNLSSIKRSFIEQQEIDDISGQFDETQAEKNRQNVDVYKKSAGYFDACVNQKDVLDDISKLSLRNNLRELLARLISLKASFQAFKENVVDVIILSNKNSSDALSIDAQMGAIEVNEKKIPEFKKKKSNNSNNDEVIAPLVSKNADEIREGLDNTIANKKGKLTPKNRSHSLTNIARGTKETSDNKDSKLARTGSFRVKELPVDDDQSDASEQSSLPVSSNAASKNPIPAWEQLQAVKKENLENELDNKIQQLGKLRDKYKDDEDIKQEVIKFRTTNKTLIPKELKEAIKELEKRIEAVTVLIMKINDYKGHKNPLVTVNKTFTPSSISEPAKEASSSLTEEPADSTTNAPAEPEKKEESNESEEEKSSEDSSGVAGSEAEYEFKEGEESEDESEKENDGSKNLDSKNEKPADTTITTSPAQDIKVDVTTGSEGSSSAPAEASVAETIVIPPVEETKEESDKSGKEEEKESTGNEEGGSASGNEDEFAVNSSMEEDEIAEKLEKIEGLLDAALDELQEYVTQGTATVSVTTVVERIKEFYKTYLNADDSKETLIKKINDGKKLLPEIETAQASMTVRVIPGVITIELAPEQKELDSRKRKNVLIAQINGYKSHFVQYGGKDFDSTVNKKLDEIIDEILKRKKTIDESINELEVLLASIMQKKAQFENERDNKISQQDANRLLQQSKIDKENVPFKAFDLDNPNISLEDLKKLKALLGEYLAHYSKLPEAKNAFEMMRLLTLENGSNIQQQKEIFSLLMGMKNAMQSAEDYTADFIAPAEASVSILPAQLSANVAEDKKEITSAAAQVGTTGNGQVVESATTNVTDTKLEKLKGEIATLIASVESSQAAVSNNGYKLLAKKADPVIQRAKKAVQNPSADEQTLSDVKKMLEEKFEVLSKIAKGEGSVLGASKATAEKTIVTGVANVGAENNGEANNKDGVKTTNVQPGDTPPSSTTTVPTVPEETKTLTDASLVSKEETVETQEGSHGENAQSESNDDKEDSSITAIAFDNTEKENLIEQIQKQLAYISTTKATEKYEDLIIQNTGLLKRGQNSCYDCGSSEFDKNAALQYLQELQARVKANRRACIEIENSYLGGVESYQQYFDHYRTVSEDTHQAVIELIKKGEKPALLISLLKEFKDAIITIAGPSYTADFNPTQLPTNSTNPLLNPITSAVSSTNAAAVQTNSNPEPTVSTKPAIIAPVDAAPNLNPEEDYSSFEGLFDEVNNSGMHDKQIQKLFERYAPLMNYYIEQGTIVPRSPSYVLWEKLKELYNNKNKDLSESEAIALVELYGQLESALGVEKINLLIEIPQNASTTVVTVEEPFSSTTVTVEPVQPPVDSTSVASDLDGSQSENEEEFEEVPLRISYKDVAQRELEITATRLAEMTAQNYDVSLLREELEKLQEELSHDGVGNDSTNEIHNRIGKLKTSVEQEYLKFLGGSNTVDDPEFTEFTVNGRNDPRSLVEAISAAERDGDIGRLAQLREKLKKWLTSVKNIFSWNTGKSGNNSPSAQNQQPVLPNVVPNVASLPSPNAAINQQGQDDAVVVPILVVDPAASQEPIMVLPPQEIHQDSSVQVPDTDQDSGDNGAGVFYGSHQAVVSTVPTTQMASDNQDSSNTDLDFEDADLSEPVKLPKTPTTFLLKNILTHPAVIGGAVVAGAASIISWVAFKVNGYLLLTEEARNIRAATTLCELAKRCGDNEFSVETFKKAYNSLRSDLTLLPQDRIDYLDGYFDTYGPNAFEVFVRKYCVPAIQAMSRQNTKKPTSLAKLGSGLLLDWRMLKARAIVLNRKP